MVSTNGTVINNVGGKCGQDYNNVRAKCGQDYNNVGAKCGQDYNNVGDKCGQDYIVEDCDDSYAPNSETPYYITVEKEGRTERLQIEPPDESQFTIQSHVYTNSAYPWDGEKSEKAAYQLNHLAGVNYLAVNKDVKKKNKKRRIVAKSGDTNVNLYNLNERKKQYLKDMFTTMVDMQWRYTLFAFVSSFLLSWLLFAFFWWGIGLLHGDFLLRHAIVSQEEYQAWLATANGSFPRVPCVLGIKDFTSAFLFSVETQHTIGYGSRYTTEECPEAIILQCIQSIAGVVIQACMVGIVFAKLSRPKTRQNTVMFSSNACVTQRNGDLYLQFRVGNMRTSKLLESHVRAIFVHHNKSTDEGENVYFHQEILPVGSQLDGEDENVFLFWPIIISHKITSDSPFYSMSPEDIIKSHFEIIIILDGVVEPTGNNMQARTSYLPNEIMWGYRFDNMVKYSKKQGVYAVDCSQLNVITADDTPRYSAAQLDNNKKLFRPRKSNSTKSQSFSETGLFRMQHPRRSSLSTDSGVSSMKHPRRSSEGNDSGVSSFNLSQGSPSDRTAGYGTPNRIKSNRKKLSKKLSFYLNANTTSSATLTSSPSQSDTSFQRLHQSP